MTVHRAATTLLLVAAPSFALAQSNQPSQTEASCLAGFSMTDERRGFIDRWVQINRFRSPPKAGETHEAWRTRQRTSIACAEADKWRREDGFIAWERYVIAMPEARQRELWAEVAAERARRSLNPPGPSPDGKPAPSPVTVVWEALQARWQAEDAAAAKAPAPQPTQPPLRHQGACALTDERGRDYCLLPVWYVMNERGCERVDTVIGDERSRIRTPADFQRSARAEGVTVTLKNLPGSGQLVEATAAGSSAMLVFAPNFLSCAVTFNVRLREAEGKPRVDMRPQLPPAWVAALGGD